ncbi:hypothetical protein SBV1_1480044 [Verrucomicrobia bacterium]|nr:hypothetical protein SBV1_1480044 [Verrucomicrobiota bacterium]
MTNDEARKNEEAQMTNGTSAVRLLERALKISRAVLRAGRAAGFVAPRLQISTEYAPSSPLAIHPAPLAIPFRSIFKTRS